MVAICVSSSRESVAGVVAVAVAGAVAVVVAVGVAVAVDVAVAVFSGSTREAVAFAVVVAPQ